MDTVKNNKEKEWEEQEEDATGRRMITKRNIRRRRGRGRVQGIYDE